MDLRSQIPPVTDVNAASQLIAQRIRADAEHALPENFSVVYEPGFCDPSFVPRDAIESLRDVIVAVGGHRLTAGLDIGIEEACARAASAVQDEVAQSNNVGWPEIMGVAGVSLGIADACLTDGIARWSLRGHSIAPIGFLRPTCKCLGITIGAIS